MGKILEVKNLTTGFTSHKDYFRVVDQANFHIEEGEIVGIVGESGSGKSVTSLSVMRLISSPGKIDKNSEILFDGVDLNKLPEREMRKIRGHQISMIFQEPMSSLNPVHTIGRQIGESLKIHLGLNKTEARRRAVELLNQVGIPRAEQIVDMYPHHLSGGMRQRVMIAMAMSCQPKLLIADEPTTALDVTIQAQILKLMKKLKQDAGTSILLITHDLGVVAETCDRVMVMYAGQVVEEGPVLFLFDKPSHPYTKGLLSSIPDLEVGNKRLKSIPGTVPSFQEMPPGCRFAPRCSEAEDICWAEEPTLQFIEEAHQCRCFVAQQGGVSQ